MFLAIEQARQPVTVYRHAEPVCLAYKQLSSQRFQTQNREPDWDLTWWIEVGKTFSIAGAEVVIDLLFTTSTVTGIRASRTRRHLLAPGVCPNPRSCHTIKEPAQKFTCNIDGLGSCWHQVKEGFGNRVCASVKPCQAGMQCKIRPFDRCPDRRWSCSYSLS